MPVLGAKTMPPTRMNRLSLYLANQMISWQIMDRTGAKGHNADLVIVAECHMRRLPERGSS
jgi:hypothetical protein